MVKFSQTSWFESEKEEALHLLQYVPLRVTVEETPLLHYHAPDGFISGASVHYRLISGLHRLDWTGIISSASETTVVVRLNLGPFRGFDAKHSFVDEEGLFSCHDDFSFQGEETSFKNAIEQAKVFYAFEARRNTEKVSLAVEAERETRQFEAFDQDMCAG